MIFHPTGYIPLAEHHPLTHTILHLSQFPRRECENHIIDNNNKSGNFYSWCPLVANIEN